MVRLLYAILYIIHIVNEHKAHGQHSCWAIWIFIITLTKILNVENGTNTRTNFIQCSSLIVRTFGLWSWHTMFVFQVDTSSILHNNLFFLNIHLRLFAVCIRFPSRKKRQLKTIEKISNDQFRCEFKTNYQIEWLEERTKKRICIAYCIAMCYTVCTVSIEISFYRWWRLNRKRQTKSHHFIACSMFIVQVFSSFAVQRSLYFILNASFYWKLWMKSNLILLCFRCLRGWCCICICFWSVGPLVILFFVII